MKGIISGLVDLATDAQFRVWGLSVNAALTAAGWVFVDDAGHIDWATVAKPGQGAKAGWEIWRMDDTLQATYPVFLKLQYGITSNGASNKGLWLTFGPSTNGSGVMNAPASLPDMFINAGNTSGSGVPYPTYYGGDTNRFWIMHDAGFLAGSTTVQCGFAVERTKDGSGRDTNLGLVIMLWVGGNQYFVTYSHVIGSKVSVVTDISNKTPALLPSVGRGSTGAQTSVYPIFPPTFGPFLNPLMNAMMGFSENFTVWTPVTFTHYGAARTYLPVAINTYPGKALGDAQGFAGTSLYLMRWE